MKKHILTFLGLLSSLGVFAQYDFVDNTPSYGVKGGYNYANLQGTTAVGSSLSGIHTLFVGVFARFPLGNNFTLQPEALFSRQGAKWKREGLLPSGDVYQEKFLFDNINIPIMTNIKVAEKLDLQVGPQFGFLVTPPDIWNDTPIFNGKKQIDKNAYKFFNFGLAIGGNYRLGDRYFVDLRYTISLTNVFNKSDETFRAAQIGTQNYFRHSYFSVGFAYIIW